MSRRLLRRLPLLLTGVVLLASLSLFAADGEPKPDQGEPPVRLKKKRPAPKAEEPEPARPAPARKKEKPDEARDKEDRLKKEGDKKSEPAEPEQDEKEVLDRIVKNMRSVEKKLGDRKLGEGTRQTQADILKDLDSLIEMSQRPQGESSKDDQGAESEQDQQDRQEQQGQAGRKGQSRGSQSKGMGPRRGGEQGGSSGQGQAQGGSRGNPFRQRLLGKRPGSGSRLGSRRAGGKQPGGQPREARTAGPRNGEQQRGNGQENKQQLGKKGGGQPGGGGGLPPRDRQREVDRNADLHKDIWGHLPEALRPEMNAYSNPQPFLPQYDDLIKKYYRTIAEQGRRKGD